MVSDRVIEDRSFIVSSLLYVIFCICSLTAVGGGTFNWHINEVAM